jgi:serine/threonine protein kinase/tetratricopeptide (TPR) repeat protein
MRADEPDRVTAVVILRSRSGQALRDLSTQRLAASLEADRPPREAADAVRLAFETRGFSVVPDPHLPTLTLTAPSAVFASCFNISETALERDGRNLPLELMPPDDLRPLIEAVTLLPAPPATTRDDGRIDGSVAEGPDLAGSTIGRFRIVARLGSGGMGEVYRAEDTQLKRTVAIKRLARSRRDPTISNAELLREARRASALNHPHVASIHDVFAVGDELFLVMEFIDGSTLRDRLQSPLGVSEFCTIAIQCVDALKAAHHNGIVHGDLKPSNIMLTRERGDVKVCDFGLARRLQKTTPEAETTSTVSRGLAGTPPYMPPEGIREEHLDERSDVFSLGVVFYEMLAGHNPFQAGSVIATLDRIRNFSPEPLDRANRHVMPALARMVQRMIEKDPLRRYASMAEIGEELASIQAALPEFTRPRQWPFHVALGLALSGAIVTLVVVLRSQGCLVSPTTTASVPASINLAILPFEAVGANVDRQFFSQGLAEAVTRQLSRLTLDRRFQVATNDDVLTRHVTSSTEAREQLGSNLVLTGSLQYSGSTVQITCRLIDTKSGRPIRSETFAVDAANPAAMQDLVSHAGIRMMELTVKPEQQDSLGKSQPPSPTAYDFYLQARGYLMNYDRIESLDSAVTVFRRALEIDPRYALAYAGLGQAYWRKHELTGAALWVEPARGACESALGIDPRGSEGHTCLAMVLSGTGAYERAAKEFATALDLEPTNDLACQGLATAYERLNRQADAERTYRRAIELRPHYWAAYNTLGGYYYRVGRYDDALAMFQRVVELAPDSFRGYSSVGALYFTKDRLEDAVAAFNKSLAIRPNYVAASNLGTLYYFEGKYREAADAFRQALSFDQGNYQVWGNLAGALRSLGDAAGAAAASTRERALVQERLSVNPRDPVLQLALATCDAALGDLVKARASLAQVVKASPSDPEMQFDIAVLYEYWFHEREEGLTWLTKAIDGGQTWREIERSPYLAELRKDSRFEQLRRRR